MDQEIKSAPIPHNAEEGQKFKTTATNVYAGETFCYPEGSIVVFIGTELINCGLYAIRRAVFRYEGETKDRMFQEDELAPI